ncbi:S-adenosyl-L-methionine-dependent methyltransferase [Multifurca ochricompacta]|uniref:S-adenosyl-L-methionine-dependent methyltransferase n=1 Tax=Multifurca ochricompacta TaxID=376703 RepID=A0AAD4M9V0_9AGAM|nr:S-adenosyl-L-methionine-dependent methyltransferase [Multifurca ochricompacta]
MIKDVYEVARIGFGKGTNELYDRARPSYPPDALSYIHQEVTVSHSKPLNVVEIGSGTGIFTRALLAHPDWATTVGKLTAVEPSEGMRTIFSKSVLDERVSCQEGSFENTGVSSHSADLVVIAQAFHWCPDYDAAAAEFARILKPGGIEVLIWNLEDREAAAWVAQVRDLIEQFEQGTPQFRLNLWRAFFETRSFESHFQPQQEHSWSYSLVSSLDTSYIAVKPEDIKSMVKAKIKEIVDIGDGKRWIDEDKGLFEYPYTTLVIVFKRK